MDGSNRRPVALDRANPHVRGTMDERHHPYPQQQPHHADPQSTGPAPWPSYQQPHAPIAYQQSQPASQFQYATNDFVQPGAPGGHGQPMSAHGGNIGTPLPATHPDAMPMLHGGAALDPYAQQQTWAFPTPHGLQLVQHGAPGDPMHAMVATAQRPVVRRRMKWETIIPGTAIACLVAAVALFISDFDRITGRTTDLPSSAAARSVADTKAAADDESSTVAEEATALFDAGRFDEAAALLQPLLDVDAPDAAIVALHDRITTADARNETLLMQVQRQRRAGNWAGVVATIAQLEQLRPLSPNLTELRAQARRASTMHAAVARTKALMAKGRDTEALAVIDTALKIGPSRQLRSLRAQIVSRRAAAAKRRASGSGGHSGHSTAPPPGGRSGSGTTARPPASSPSTPARIPPRPGSNPVNNTANNTVTPPVGGGGGNNCHTHDGVTECHG